MTENWKQKAYEKLLRDGWRTGAAGWDDEPCCAGGAIAWAVTGDPDNMYQGTHNADEWERVEPALKEFREFAGISPCLGLSVDIYHWNDTRTKEEVLGVFKRLAETEGAQ